MTRSRIERLDRMAAIDREIRQRTGIIAGHARKNEALADERAGHELALALENAADRERRSAMREIKQHAGPTVRRVA